MVHKANVVLVALMSLFLHAYSSPVLPAAPGVSDREQAKIMDYMMEYGYLESRSNEDVVRGIRQLQGFAGLELTGKMDEETVKLVKTPRCGMPDFEPSHNIKRRRRRYALHYSVWKKHDLTYKILNAPTSELTAHQVATTMRKAFDMWSEVSPLTFRQVWSGDAEIVISFVARKHGDDYPFYGKGGKIAHAFYPHANIDPEDGDIHFDDDEHWTLGKAEIGAVDFMWAAVHEIGHSIGVRHSYYWDAIMYPDYTGYKPDLKLHEDDIMAIQAKYGKRKLPTATPTLHPSSKVNGPSPCDVEFDAVVRSGDGNTYFFKDPYFWTLDKHNRPLGGGRKIVDHWEKLHPRVQAAYTRPDGKTVFFKAKKYWVFEGLKRIEGPKLMSEYGLPIELKRLDAAFTWGGDGNTYLFKGSKYWRYNEKTKRIDKGYPKNIRQGEWGAVPCPVNAVMTWSDGNTYFFNGLNVSKYEFPKRYLHKPRKISDLFFKCNERDHGNEIAALKETVLMVA